MERKRFFGKIGEFLWSAGLSILTAGIVSGVQSGSGILSGFNAISLAGVVILVSGLLIK